MEYREQRGEGGKGEARETESPWHGSRETAGRAAGWGWVGVTVTSEAHSLYHSTVCNPVHPGCSYQEHIVMVRRVNIEQVSTFGLGPLHEQSIHIYRYAPSNGGTQSLVEIEIEIRVLPGIRGDAQTVTAFFPIFPRVLAEVSNLSTTCYSRRRLENS